VKRSGLRLAAFICAALWVGAACAQDEARKAFRVCQDPNNLPFANTKGEGFENRIAELFAKQLKLPVEYYSFPQRMGFIRNTLRYRLPGQDFPCDIVMGWPPADGSILATKPYYRSTYALVYPKGKKIGAVAKEEDFLRLPKDVLHSLKIGLYDRTPASQWLARHGLVDQGVPYRLLNADPDHYPGQIIERDLASGKIDVAIVWGPIAGFFSKRVSAPQLAVVPLKSEENVKFDFEIAMAVRLGEKKLKDELDALIDKNKSQINTILREYGVPLVE
jgi:mxaJ protein